MNIKEKILGLKDFAKKVFEKYPLTMVIVLAYTVFLSFTIDGNLVADEWMEKIFLFVVIWIFGVFLIENIDKLGKSMKIIGKVITAIIAGFFVVVLTQPKYEFDFIGRLCICYMIALPTIALFLIIKKSDKSIPEYLLKVGINFTKVSFIYGVLAVGFLLIYEIFDFLILDSKGEFIDNLELLLFGFYYVPKMIYALDDLKEEVNAFFKGLVKWVLMSLLSIAFIIIYLYILKIIILRDMPKNQIFRILAALFVTGAPIWTCMQYFKEDSFVYKLSLKLPLAFIPFIFLQIYTIGIRISSHGVTPLRYMCVMLVLFEIVYELYYIIKKDRIRDLIVLANAFVIIAILVPGLNLDDFSNMSQAKILKIYKENTKLTDEQKDKIYGAYSYLSRSENGEKYIETILTEADEEEIEGFASKSSRDYESYEHFSYSKNDNIDIGDYSTLTVVNASGYNNRSYSSFDDEIILEFDNVDFKSNYKSFVKVDCTDYVEDLIKAYQKSGKKDMQSYFEENHEIKIDKDSKIVLTNITITYNITQKSISSYSFNGMYLKK